MTLWDLYQHSQIRTVRKSQHMADHQALLRDQRTERDVEELEERLGELAVVVEALWTLCRDRLGLDDDTLTGAVAEVTARREAEAAAGPLRCPSCDAAVSVELDRCQFCGAESPRGPRPATAF